MERVNLSEVPNGQVFIYNSNKYMKVYRNNHYAVLCMNLGNTFTIAISSEAEVEMTNINIRDWTPDIS